MNTTFGLGLLHCRNVSFWYQISNSIAGNEMNILSTLDHILDSGNFNIIATRLLPRSDDHISWYTCYVNLSCGNLIRQ
jgi:predicted membrane channel-forming protein YqfA (hemolysin III family)